MLNADRQFYLSISEKTGFHKDVIEKVHRLLAILEFNTYRPELLFSGEMLGRVKDHPMALWRTSQMRGDKLV